MVIIFTIGCQLKFQVIKKNLLNLLENESLRNHGILWAQSFHEGTIGFDKRSLF